MSPVKIRLSDVYRRSAMTEDVVDFAPFQTRIDGDDDGPCLQAPNVRERDFQPVQKMYGDTVAGLHARSRQVGRNIVCKTVELRVCPGLFAPCDGDAIRASIARTFECGG